MSQEKDITIYDIARELDISAATVSRGLQNHPSVSIVTRRKVQELAKELGYRSNTFASSLRKKSIHTIGVIVPRLSSYFMSTVIAGMESIASAEGYNLLISQSLETLKKEMANAETMFNSRVDGLLVSLSFESDHIDHFEPFIRKGIPLVFFDRVVQHPLCMGIVIDNYNAAYEATKHLLDNGYKRIMHIGGNTVSHVYAERLRGYTQALTDHGIMPDPRLILTKDMTEESGVESAKHILKMKQKPDAVFSANDVCAVYCMRTLKQEGLKIPGDMAFVGFNNDPLSKVAEPNLTTINYPGYAMGEAAARQLIGHLRGTGNLVSTPLMVLRSELVVRASSPKKR